MLELLLPGGCVACGAWIPARQDALVCGPCRSRLRPSSWPRCLRCDHPLGSGRRASPQCIQCRDWPDALTAARHAFVLDHPADDLVHALKYEGWQELTDYMGDAVASLVDRLRSEADASHSRPVIVPVPTTSERSRARGYNQAELLAIRVATGCGLVLSHALTRSGGGRSQTSLTPSERRENVRGAFRPTSGAGSDIRGADVLLVDDVLTTGATASEAALTLAGMGAGTVTLLTFARALADTPAKARSALS